MNRLFNGDRSAVSDDCARSSGSGQQRRSASPTAPTTSDRVSAPRDLTRDLLALASAQSTQRSSPWHRSSLFHVAWIAAASVAAGVGGVHWWRSANSDQRIDGADFHAVAQELAASHPASTALTTNPGAAAYFRRHGAPVRFYPPAEFAGYRLDNVEVVFLGEPAVPVAVRRFVSAQPGSVTDKNRPAAFRVFTVNRERLNEDSLQLPSDATDQSAVTVVHANSDDAYGAGSPLPQFVFDCCNLSVIVPEKPENAGLARY